MTLRPDETKCVKCLRLFVSPDAFVGHEAHSGKCLDPEAVGLIYDHVHGYWRFPGKDPAHKLRKSNAQAAFDRIVASLPETTRRELAADLKKVHTVLERERNR